MAQALFDDHPIEHYLRDSGEVPELMPGGIAEFSLGPDVPYTHTLMGQWLPRILHAVLHIREFTGLRSSSAASEFAEKFKYIVISSSLLSSSLSSSSITRAATPTTPGHYEQSPPHLSAMTPMTTLTVSCLSSQFLTLSVACLVPVAFAQGYYLFGLLILGVVTLLADGVVGLPLPLRPDRGDEPWIMTLESLESLVAANNAWDGVLSEALEVLETDERPSVHSSPPFSPSQSLRVAISSSLHTTQTQCDDVRQLLAALTSPLVLSQLSHMYAPPSPFHMSSSSTRPRPMSVAALSTLPRSNPYSRASSLSTPSDDAHTRARVATLPKMSSLDKRSTWNGSYMSLAGGPSPRRPRQRSNLSTIIRLEDLRSPKSPNFPAPDRPDNVSSYSPEITIAEDAGGDADAEDEPFGMAALGMHRKRRSARNDMFDPPSPSSSTTLTPLSGPSISRFSGSFGSPLTASFGSHFTSFSTPPSTSQMHSLSLSKLHLGLQGALGSKRFACAHLLALRFPGSTLGTQKCSGSDVGSDTDGEDESYWEDVRSVIALLTSTLEDTSARLAEALADTAQMQVKERETLTDEESCLGYALPEYPESGDCSKAAPHSFAPMPSHLTRFAAHIDAITSALDDARDHLQECVRSLRDHTGDARKVTTDIDPPTLQSYERLRRELGLAFRECERGRGTLLEIVDRGTPDLLKEEVVDEESLTRHEDHFSSGESDKTLYNAEESPELHVEQGQDHDPAPHEDDATSHLILTASAQHLTPPGIEQVFESVSASQPFVRERSKLTRDERIRLAKARRQSQLTVLSSVPGGQEGEQRPARESWGPGGEVVQELKDVIWKVGEQRRKMVERSSLRLHSDTSHLPAPC